MNTSVSRFFQIAIWLPFIGLLIILLGDWIYQKYDISTEQTVLIYWLGFGVLAYPVFAIWATRYIKKKSEPAIVRLIWLAPIIFIPFYGVPWVLYGLAHIVMGEMSGIGMALLWVSFSPYIIVVGYVFSGATFVVYELFFRTVITGHEAMHETTNAAPRIVVDAKLFGNIVGNGTLISDGEAFSLYPRKTFLGQQGLFAYHAILMITDDEFEKFCALVWGTFGQATIKQTQAETYLNGDGAALQLAVRQEFNGLIIEVITNSKVLLEGLDASFKAPPPPWFAFPKMEPIEAVMSKQGSLEYWWRWIWTPFWEHASAEDQANYLRDHKASNEWAECLAGQTSATD